MPTPDTTTPGAPCWVDLFSSDADGARTFYGELFGWTSEANPDFGGYVNFSKDGVRVAGLMQNDDPGAPSDFWTTYLRVADAKATVDAVVAGGGQVFAPAMDVGDLGVMAVVADPGGAGVGMWQPGEHPGFGVVAESGSPCWFELHTRDYERAVAFYRDVFGWDSHTMSDTPEFRYTTLGEGESQQAGIMDDSVFPDGPPAHWAIYFGVDDADAALVKIVELGGSVLEPAEDSPYGRLAVAADPTGAPFRIVQDLPQA